MMRKRVYAAVTRPNRRFAPIKTEEQQAIFLHHPTRQLLVRQMTQVVNAICPHLAEFGNMGQVSNPPPKVKGLHKWIFRAR
jgi:transposase